jgi:hypothetical protein
MDFVLRCWDWVSLGWGYLVTAFWALVGIGMICALLAAAVQLLAGAVRWIRLGGMTMTIKQPRVLVVVALVAGLFGGVISTLLLRSMPPGVVKASRFVVIDDEGRTRARLGMLPDGGASLWLLDDKENERVEVYVSREGDAGTVLKDAQGYERASLSLLSGETPAMVLTDDDEKIRTVLDVRSDGSPGLEFRDAAGKEKVVLGVLADGSPALTLDQRHFTAEPRGAKADRVSDYVREVMFRSMPVENKQQRKQAYAELRSTWKDVITHRMEGSLTEIQQTELLARLARTWVTKKGLYDAAHPPWNPNVVR